MKPIESVGVLLLSVVILTSCGPSAEISRARSLEKKGNYYKAWESYQAFAAKHPQHSSAPEALFRAGWLAQKQLKDCYKANVFYEEVLARYPQADPWARIAALQQHNCPDYFPLLSGMTWTEGDSDTKGQNARIEIVSKPSPQKSLPSESGLLARSYFGGKTKFKTTEFLYKKTDAELLEFESESDPRSKVILKWPLEPGTKWRTKAGGRLFDYEIVAKDKKISAAAGEFEGCLQVTSSVEGLAGATNEYYAPGVGRVLTTFSTQAGEKRNTELLNYKTVDDPDFTAGGELK